MYRGISYLFVIICFCVYSVCGITFIEQAGRIAHDPEFQKAQYWLATGLFEKLYQENVGKKRSDDPFAPLLAAGANTVLKSLQYLNNQPTAYKSPAGHYDRTRFYSDPEGAFNGTRLTHPKLSDVDIKFLRTMSQETDPQELVNYANTVKKWYIDKTLPTVEDMMELVEKGKRGKGTKRDDDEDAEQEIFLSPFEAPDPGPENYWAPEQMRAAKIPLVIEGTSKKYAFCTNSGDDAYANWGEKDAAIIMGFWKLTEGIRLGGMALCCLLPPQYGARNYCNAAVFGPTASMTAVIMAQYNYLGTCGDLLDLLTLRTQALQVQQFYEQVIEMRRFQVEEALRSERYVASYLLPETNGGQYEMVSDITTRLIDEMRTKYPTKSLDHAYTFLGLSRVTSNSMKTRYQMLSYAYQSAADLL